MEVLVKMDNAKMAFIKKRLENYKGNRFYSKEYLEKEYALHKLASKYFFSGSLILVIFITLFLFLH